MNPKAYLYFIVAIFVIFSLDSININNIFKKNKNLQAKLFYFFLAFIMIYLITNFIYDLTETFNLF